MYNVDAKKIYLPGKYFRATEQERLNAFIAFAEMRKILGCQKEEEKINLKKEYTWL